ncbi:lycopene cyclase family protein [Flavobacterium luminosum]|uniref:Lycopene cyclase family protein n=1 Tax=Flavobacterium luminosum TaxID=2949086 RepID=A0ABT0TNS1_9FLAO|nr:lycopene cyclase family protein [Flavobacterium sp. HXWNR70]MCL9809020.1 lycopene cyclase family protein [Flavobacterium sp. HXWNR70]
MRYDYIFSGFGLSGMMILHKMMAADLHLNKSILIIEPEDKSENDKTWSFWEKNQGNWDFLLSKSWDEAYFLGDGIKTNCMKNGYRYKSIASDLFYKTIFKKIEGCKGIVWKKEKTLFFQEQNDTVIVKTNEATYEGATLFNSFYNRNEIINNAKYPLLQQHFVGWFVKSKTPFFKENTATFMDFTIDQQGNTRFLYVLPFSSTEALVEYTLFSPELLTQTEYEEGIQDYLKKIGLHEYSITATEQGNIPMTVYPFWKKNSKRVLNIGTAGGWTKASTGYTFRNSDKLSEKVVDLLREKSFDFTNFKVFNRFTFYDKLLVRVLFDNNELGKSIFSSMFSKVSPDKIFRFLDEESSLQDELQVILSCPKLPFIKALFKS